MNANAWRATLAALADDAARGVNARARLGPPVAAVLAAVSAARGGDALVRR
jgi:hypothetical protein